MNPGPRLLVLITILCPVVWPAHAGLIGAGTPGYSGTDSPPQPRPALQQVDRKIMAGQATFAEVRTALANPDIGALTNTVHGLYSMRWHRGVYNLLHDMWALRKEGFPELQWDQFAKAPVRLALASTLLRVEPLKSREYVDYLREHMRDEHEFHRAQVLIGLAFKGEPRDVPYMVEMASGDNAFVVQAAVTALGLINLPIAHVAMEDLVKRFDGDAREPLLREVMRKAYKVSTADDRLWRELTREGIDGTAEAPAASAPP